MPRSRTVIDFLLFLIYLSYFPVSAFAKKKCELKIVCLFVELLPTCLFQLANLVCFFKKPPQELSMWQEADDGHDGDGKIWSVSPCTWSIIPVSKCLITMVSKSPK